ncbi:RNA polymerase sigma factor [Demequina sp. NBRC 110053]|uniref:RNA polymerase sigma factor n=1 Tax=Demequina sp. NBRC 110053 TaxID=1570342 RepID=UPI000A02E4F1|nr:sigma-70 family RNA polymerase sigma factor [Demequina sp. NBRC 110053]
MTATAATRERVAAFLDSDYARAVGAVALATGDRQRAEDAVQDAIVTTLSGDAEPENLAGWITVVAINSIRQQWRRGKAQRRAYLRVVTWDDPGDDESQRTVDTIAVHDALAELPERQRAAMVLHYLEGLSVAETARLLEVSEGTVKTQLSRGRAALGAMLDREAV